MLGHKRIPSREGGIEIVVEEFFRTKSNMACTNNNNFIDSNHKNVRKKSVSGFQRNRFFGLWI